MCSTLSTVLDLLRPRIVASCSPVQLRIKKADAGSFVGDIDLLVIIIGANSNKTKKVPALSAVPIAAGA